MDALKLLDKARAACDPPSWYQLARELHVTQDRIITWQKRGGAFTEDAAWEIARLTGLTFAQVIAVREAAREKNEGRRARWKARLRKGAQALAFAAVPLQPFPYANVGLWDTSPPRSCCSDSPSAPERTTKTANRHFTFLPIMRRARRARGPADAASNRPRDQRARSQVPRQATGRRCEAARSARQHKPPLLASATP